MSVVDDNLARGWDLLMSNGVSEETLTTVTNIIGYKMETLDKISEARFGLDIEQLKDENND